MTKQKYRKGINLIRTVLSLGLHIWVILLVANILLIYSVRFYTHGTVCLNRKQVIADNRCLYIWGNRVYQQGIVATLNPKPACGSDITHKLPASVIANEAKYIIPNFAADLCQPDTLASVQTALSPVPSASIAPSPSEAIFPSNTPEPTATPTPAGPVMSLTFSIPGIGSGGGTLKPLHPTRTVTILLYSPQLNSFDASVKPLYTIHATATFDPDPNSLTYNTFTNSSIDLGEQVPDGQYQIVFRSDQTLLKLIKANEDDVGGEIISLSRNIPITTTPQTLIPGDIYPYPVGDNIMDINDYNALVNCFADRITRAKCPNRQAADLNDDGVIDGIDYNLMLLSFKTLVALGFPAPVLTKAPTPSPTVIVPTSKPTPAQAAHPKVTLTPFPKKTAKGGNLFGFIFLLILLAAIGAGIFFIIKKLRKVEDIQSASPNQQTEMPSETDAPQHTAAGEFEQDNTQESVPETTGQQSQPQTPSDTNILIEKECYVKKKSADKDGTWITMTDDNGQIDGLCKGTDVLEGFVKVKGTMQSDKNTPYMLVTEITPIAE